MAERFAGSRIVAFSSGNVYPLVPVTQGGSTEATPPAPVGEYAQSALGRERMLQYFSSRNNTPMTILRLNYAIDLRYGVLLDIGQKVFERQPVNLAMGHANVIWQRRRELGLPAIVRAMPIAAGDAECDGPGDGLGALAGRALCRAVRHRADPRRRGIGHSAAEQRRALPRLFGYPPVSLEQMVEWVADWIGLGGATLNKPTHFETRDGKF